MVTPDNVCHRSTYHFSVIRLKLYFLFAKDYLLPGLLMTLITWFLVFSNGPGAFRAALLLKTGSLLLGVFGLRQYKKAELFFFRNVGLSEHRLLAVTISTDLLIWAILLFITLQLRA